MFQNEMAELERAVEQRDLDLLDSFLFPKKRTLNDSKAFHAPLMLSPQKIKHLAKIPQINADCIMLNLEDGVSEALKPFALRLAALTLTKLPESDKKIVVRVNPLGEGGEEEIRVIAGFMPDAVRVPKIRTVEEVKQVLELTPEPIEVHLSIETKEAWLALQALRPDPRVTCFYLGMLDLFADLGLDQALITPDNPTMAYILSHFLVTCRALGIKPVSFVYQDFRDEAGLDKWLELEKTMGFDAKGCISPTQGQAVMKAFGVDEAALAKAREIVALFEAERANGITGFTHVVYGFIDEPIYKGALSVLKGAK